MSRPPETTSPSTGPVESSRPANFIRRTIVADLSSGKWKTIVTRFPPEPNGYLHIGHAKSICLNFGIARDFGGRCHLRMDDTNPAKEDIEYVQSIQADVKWLISGWADEHLRLKAHGAGPQKGQANGTVDWIQEGLPASEKAALEPFYASDYFPALFEFAVELIKRGKAYVCDLTPAETSEHRGAPDRPGKPSPWRNRSVDENLDLFNRMKAGEFPDGAKTLKAKIDMASPNIWLRDPVLYRIRHTAHHHTGDAWCIYPMYDYAHCLSDYIEGITHSICTLEFDVHRALYDWILEALSLPRTLPKQFEFSRLNLTYTVMSKRKLLQLVREKLVRGWDDPRMPTLAGLRRRGVPPGALRRFCQEIGVTKYPGTVDVALLNHHIRQELNREATRRFAVLKPLKVVLTNYPQGKTEEVEALDNPESEAAGKRKLLLSRELFIEQEDFSEKPSQGFQRLRPGGLARLKLAYLIRCDEIVKAPDGTVSELHCTVDLERAWEKDNNAVLPKVAIHWVSVRHAVDLEVRLYDKLFITADPEAFGDFKGQLNTQSLDVVTAKGERSLGTAEVGVHYQFERVGYFFLDKDSSSGHVVFNRTLGLRDSWLRYQTKQARALTAEKTARKQESRTPEQSEGQARIVGLTGKATASKNLSAGPNAKAGQKEEGKPAARSNEECRLEIIRDFAPHAGLREEWDRFCEAVGAPVYLSFDWLKAWWQFYGGNCELRVLLFRRGNEIAGILPLYVQRVGIPPISIRVARLVGANLSPRVLDLPVDPSAAAQIWRKAVEVVFGELRCDLLSLGPVAESCHATEALLEACRGKTDLIGAPEVIRREVHTSYHLPSSFEQFFASVDARERKTRRRRLKDLEEAWPVRVEIVRDPQKVEAEFEEFQKQHTEYWNSEKRPGHFYAWPEALAYNRELVRTQGALGRLFFVKLFAGDKVVANQYCYGFGNTLYAELPSRIFGSEWDQFSLGCTSQLKLLEAAIDAGFSRMESGVGHYEYKVLLNGVEEGVNMVRIPSARGSAQMRIKMVEKLSSALRLIILKGWYRRIAPRLPGAERRSQPRFVLDLDF